MPKQKTVGFFGGSFNPPHIGHLLAAVYAKHTFQLDEVWFAPVTQHAFGKTLPSFLSRKKKLEKLLQGFEAIFKISSVETNPKLDGKTYHTLLHLKQKHPKLRLKLIVGSDQWVVRKKWFKFNEIQKEFGVCVVPRDSYGKGSFFIPNYSSTKLRKNLRVLKHA